MEKVTTADVIAAIEDPVFLGALKTEMNLRGLSVLTKQDFDKQRGEITSEIASRVEADITEHLGGVKNDPEEKYYAYLKRASTELKTSHAKELVEIRAKMGANADEALRKEFSDLQAKHNGVTARLSEIEGVVIPAMEKEMVSSKVKSTIDGYVANMKFQNIPKAVLNNYIASVVTEVSNKASVNETGDVTFKNGDGTSIYHNGALATLEHMLNTGLSEVLESAPTPGGGTGSPKGLTTTYQHPVTGKAIVVPASVKTQVDLTRFLQVDCALKQNAEVYIKITQEFGSKLPLR